MWYYVQWDLTQFEKGKGILTQATPWTDLEDVIPREVSQSWKNRYCMISLIRAI